MSFASDLALVSWHEIKKIGEWGLHRRGTGETGIWHYHPGSDDCGSNPADGVRAEMKCRTCGAKVPFEIYWELSKIAPYIKNTYRHPHIEFLRLRSLLDSGFINEGQWRRLTDALHTWFNKNKQLCRDRQCSFYTDVPNDGSLKKVVNA